MTHPLNKGTSFKSKLLPKGNIIEVLSVNFDSNALLVTYHDEEFEWDLKLTLEGFNDGEYQLV